MSALEALWASGTGRLSIQVLQEFFVNVTQKIKTPVARATAREVIAVYSPWIHSLTTASTVIRASNIAETAHISFWDALIVAAAEEMGATKIFSEDLNAKQSIAGIQIINPLSSDIDL